VAADGGVVLVGADDHDRGVPADEPADAFLEALVARIRRLLIGADRVDVRGLHEHGHVEPEVTSVIDDAPQEEAQAHGALVLGDGGDGLDPLGGLDRIGVRELVGRIAEHDLPGRTAVGYFDRGYPLAWTQVVVRSDGRAGRRKSSSEWDDADRCW